MSYDDTVYKYKLFDVFEIQIKVSILIFHQAITNQASCVFIIKIEFTQFIMIYYRDTIPECTK